MDVEPSIGARLERMEHLLAALERRVAALELAGAPTGGTAAAVPSAREGEVVAPLAADSDVRSLLPLLGRTFMVLGGAFLLRALTDSGRISLRTGIALGLAYALAWLAAAHRAAVPGSAFSAGFHGLSGIAIGLPLLWEAATRYSLMSPATSALAIGLFAGAALAVAWHRHVHSLAAIVTVATMVTAVGLVGRTGVFVPFGWLLVTLGLAALWLGYERDWYWLRWLTALVADVALVGLTTRTLSRPADEPAGPVLALLLFLLGGYLASFALRTLVRGRLVIPFEVVQTLAVLGIGLGGALAVAPRTGAGATQLGVATTLLGAGAYGAALAFVGRRQGLGKNFYFYATLALVLTATGLAVLLPPTGLAWACAGLAVLAGWLGARLSRAALVLHAAVFSLTAAGVSGLLGSSLAAFVSPSGAFPPLGPAAWGALVSAALCLALPRPAASEAPDAVARLPRFCIGAVVLAGVGTVALQVLVPMLGGPPPPAGALASLRTGVVAIAAVGLAGATRHERLSELGWWLYPVLLAGAVKLLAEDLRRSEPAMLFVALALFGGALVAAPRLARRGPQAHAPAGPPDPGGPRSGSPLA